MGSEMCIRDSLEDGRALLNARSHTDFHENGNGHSHKHVGAKTLHDHGNKSRLTPNGTDDSVRVIDSGSGKYFGITKG